MRFTLSVFFFLFIQAGNTQNPIVLKFDSAFPANQRVVFYSYNKTKPVIISTFTRGKNDSLLLTGVTEPGLCMLTFEQSMVMGEFIYNPKERIVIELNAPSLYNGQLVIKKSRENVGYQDLLKINFRYDTFLDSLQNARSGISIATSGYTKKCYSIDSLYDKVAREKNSRLTMLQFHYFGTYTAQHLVPIHLIPVRDEQSSETPYAYIASHYFKYVDPAMVSFRHSGIYNYINKYFTSYIPNDDAGIKSAVNEVIGAFNRDTSVLNEVIRFMIQSFIDQSLPKYAWYTLSRASGYCPVDWVDQGQDFTGNKNHVTMGSVIDDIVLKTINDEPASLYNTIKKSKTGNVLLVFWTNTCSFNNFVLSHLTGEKDKRKSTVFAVYLGDNKEEWKNMVNEYQLKNWIHVSELKPVEKSSLVQRFMVTTTPSGYSINRENKVIDSFPKR